MEPKYQNNNSPWGPTALFEGQHLTFSAIFNAESVNKRTWENILAFFKKPKPKGFLQEVDLYQLFNYTSKKTWNRAYVLAKKHKAEVSIEYLFLALLNNPSVKNLFFRMAIPVDPMKKFLKNYLELKPQNAAGSLKKIPFEAYALAIKLHNPKIDSFMLLGALIKCAPKDSILHAMFSNVGLTLEKLEVMTVFILNLGYNFPKNSPAQKLYYCLEQSAGLEQHFGYTYEFPAIQRALNISSGQTLKDLEHKKALQILVKAGILAKKIHTKIITESLVIKAAT